MVLSREKAFEIVSVRYERDYQLTGATELRDGWFFPAVDGAPPGSNGIIVGKQTGRMLVLGSAFPVERDLRLYDRGYQFQLYDLVVTRVADHERALDALQRLGMRVVEPSFEHGVVWRVPRLMTRDELRSRIEKLPAVFGGVHLYFALEALEAVREARWFRFELLEYRGPPSDL